MPIIPSLLQASEIASQPLATFLYSLLLLLITLAALGMAWGEWRRVGHEQSQRLLIAMVGLVLARMCYLAAVVLARVGWVAPQVLLPPLERFVDTASIAILGWAFMPPARRNPHAWDLVFAANLVLALGACAGSVVLWNRVLTSVPSLSYNSHWQSFVWSAWQMGLAILAMLAAQRGRGAGWGTLLAAMIVVILGQILQVAPPLATESQVPIWERLANLVAYPLIAIAVYQRILADLVVQGRQLQDISQASLDQIKSLLDLVEANQQVSSSLDLTTVLDNAVDGVARALEADQCAIVFPSETHPNEMHLVAVRSPMRQSRREAASFPLEFQLTIQQAMRRKTHVIIEEADNVQLRALFALLGSSQTGPLLVLPLLENQGAMGALVVGNGQSRRPFGPNDVKLGQALATQIVLAIQNSRRYRLAQDRIAKMITAQNKTRRASLQARAEIQELTDRLATERHEVDAVRQERDSLEIKLVSGRAETDTLSRRVAVLEAELARRHPDGPEKTWDPESGIIADLKDPITRIIGYVDLLLSEATGTVPETQRKYLLRIKSSAEEVLRTIPSPGERYNTHSSSMAEDEGQETVRQQKSMETDMTSQESPTRTV
jgi:GAF domain-containing protein